ncbi:MAG: hypothetical protein OXD38_05390 [Aestuariivita sp.]|nr:hypothetical protein [Aestuariivita sp.]
MAEPHFDTHREFDRFVDAGFETKQAEAIVHSLQAVLIGGVATKADIERLEAVSKADIERLEAATKADIERFEAATKTSFEGLEAANKADIERLEAATKAGFERFEAKVEARIAQNANMHLKWLIGTAIALGGAIIGYLHYFGGVGAVG